MVDEEVLIDVIPRSRC